MKTVERYDPPIETLAELIARLDQFVNQSPVPSADSKPRQVRLVVTVGGRVKQITVES